MSNHLLIGKYVSKLNHAPQTAQAKAVAVLLHQLCRQRRHNLFTVFSALFLQHFLVDSLAQPPVQQGDSRIGGLGDLLAAVFNQLTQLLNQRGLHDAG